MKTVYISFLLHGNMCYDRYTKQEIRAKFPGIYAAGIRAMHRFSEVTAHIDFPGLTTLSLKHHASWLLDELRPLIERKQVVISASCLCRKAPILRAKSRSTHEPGMRSWLLAWGVSVRW